MDGKFGGGGWPGFVLLPGFRAMPFYRKPSNHEPSLRSFRRRRSSTCVKPFLFFFQELFDFANGADGNSGIAMIVPADFVKALLDGPQLTAEREACFASQARSAKNRECE